MSEKHSALAALASLYEPQPTNNSLGGLFTNPPVHSALSAIAAGLAVANQKSPQSIPPQWIYVTARFIRFLQNLDITSTQRTDGIGKSANIRSCLNSHYWGVNDATPNCALIGSWGKRTQISPPSDIDLLFVLPPSVFDRFQARGDNRQSQLLQEVKGVLANRFTRTEMRGDGQVIIVDFESIKFEVCPAFRGNDGLFYICDTNNGGSYRASSVMAEDTFLSTSDLQWNGNTRALARMLKAWRLNCNVPLKSFQLEQLAIHFLSRWPHASRGLFWYDWMLRDFFGFLCAHVNGTLTMPGTREDIPLGMDWLSKAETAHRNAIQACVYEEVNNNAAASTYWQAIFGYQIPGAI